MTLKNKKLASAALAGLLATTVIVAGDSFAAAKEGKAGCNGKDSSKMEKSSCKGSAGCKTKDKAECKTADGKEKHACKGKNSCKGQGKDGKNACKGKGSCHTDDSSAAE